MEWTVATIPANCRIVAVGVDRLPRWIDGFVARHGDCSFAASTQPAGTATENLVGTARQLPYPEPAPAEVEYAPAEVESAEAEFVEIVAADGSRAWLEVPFPPLFCAREVNLVTNFIEHSQCPRRIGVLLVRRGGYAVGIFEGATLLTSKVGSRYVQGSTKAGGWSQQRYARRRVNQATAAFAEAAEHAARILLPQATVLDGLVCGGDRAAVAATLADARLAAITRLIREPFLVVGDPRQKVLAGTASTFRSIRIFLDP